mmetsp:Transcript_162208/g.299362  ORF Transcript_162208/g.299362 Transcript_162208/m.299362 type:complete len:201 (-) Transcript_162208:6-608(-)
MTLNPPYLYLCWSWACQGAHSLQGQRQIHPFLSRVPLFLQALYILSHTVNGWHHMPLHSLRLQTCRRNHVQPSLARACPGCPRHLSESKSSKHPRHCSNFYPKSKALLCLKVVSPSHPPFLQRTCQSRRLSCPPSAPDCRLRWCETVRRQPSLEEGAQHQSASSSSHSSMRIRPHEFNQPKALATVSPSKIMICSFVGKH